MQLLTLDIVARRHLLERGLPIHYYLQNLIYGASCIRELAKDTLKIVNTVSLPVNSYGAIDLPSDFMEDVALCNEVSGMLQPIPHNDAINPLRKTNSDGQYVENTTVTGDDNSLLIENSFGWGWYWNIDSYGAPTGGVYGAKGGTARGYKVIRERRQIQLNTGETSGAKVLMYISNGQSVDNASQIPWEAHRCIQAFCDWQSSKNAALKDSAEARTYYNEKRLLRANLDQLTILDIRNVVLNSYTATIKN